MTPDCDWECVRADGYHTGECFAEWVHCDCCNTPVPADVDPTYNGGLVPVGEGLPIDGECGNLWYSHRDVLRGRFDVCVDCTGSGGGYICGFHDKDDT